MKKKTIYFLVRFSLIIGFNITLTSQNNPNKEELKFYLLDSEHGLSNNVINSIEQDSLGYIWIATTEGLNRYNGTQFKIYKKSDLNINGHLSDNYVQEIKLIDNGELLMATTSGANIFNPKKESFKILNKNSGLIGSDISSVEKGHDGSIILGIIYKGIQLISKKETKTYYYQQNNSSSLSSNEISCLATQGDSLLWVGTVNKGLNKINYRTNKITRIPFGEKSITSSITINTLFVGKDGALWIGSKDGIQVITSKGDTLSLKKNASAKTGLTDDNILAFEEDNLGQIWVGTRNGGLNIFNKSGFFTGHPSFSIKKYLPKNDGSSVFNRTVTSLKLDRDGNMWIGTSTGLNFVNPKGDPIKLLQRNISNAETLGHDRIGSLAESKDHNIWIGTDGSGLDLYNPSTGKIKHYVNNPRDPNSISNNYIISLYEDKKKRLWAGTYQGGLNRMDLETGRFTHYLKGEVENGSDVRAIFEDKNGHIWVGTNRGGLYKYIEEKDFFEYVSSLGKLDVRKIDEDTYGNLWMATYGDGILKYNPKNDTARFYNSLNNPGFKSDIIFSLIVLPKGDILAGTRNEGLMRFNPKNQSVLTFSENDGLSNSTISSMVLDGENDIWLGTFKGISHYNPETNEIYNLNSFNNIQQSEFSIGAAQISKVGTLYFGGGKGLNIFNPNDLNNNRETYPLFFEELEIFNKKVNVSDDKEKDILNESILYQNHITLNHNQTLFSINYAALKYPFVKNINYSYHLEGYHEHWINTNTNGKVNLTKIPFGTYNLKVKAQFGLGDEVTKDLLITITPPFWKTPVAYFLYIILISLALWGIAKYYSERLKLINSLHFEKKQRQLEHDFNEERIRFFTSFSHELKTPLTLILGPLEDLLLELKTKKNIDRVNLILKNSKILLQSINKLLDFRKSNLGLSKLIIDNHNLSNHLEQWVQNYNLLAEKRDIQLTYSQPEKSLMIWCDLEKLHIVVNNLLSNAFKHTNEKGKVHVSLTTNDEYFTITVEDNGSGIRSEELEHIFDWYYQSGSKTNKGGAGVGLALSKNFTELHKGEIKVQSELKKGSIFSVSIPINKNMFEEHIDEEIILHKNQMEDVDITNDYLNLPEIEVSKIMPSNIHINKNKETILLIDDNSDILEYLDGILNEHYDLIYAKDGKEGIVKAKNYVPDLIISDIMMPEIDGIDLCNTLKAHITTTHIPIILLSAKDNPNSIKTGYEEGADDYIVKPFNSLILKTRIRNLLDNRIQLRKYFLKQEKALPEIMGEGSKLLDREKKFLIQLEDIILKNIDQDNTNVETISRSMGMSRTSLFRKLKAITGLNINQYANRVKMERAEILIRDKKFTVSQASYEVGFNNVKYFRKLFKEQFGKAPSEINKE